MFVCFPLIISVSKCNLQLCQKVLILLLIVQFSCKNATIVYYTKDKQTTIAEIPKVGVKVSWRDVRHQMEGHEMDFIIIKRFI